MSIKKHSLLLIEDSSDDANLCLRAIAVCGVPCEVHVISHGGEALGLLLSPEGPLPDLVVLDYHLPGASGYEVLRGLRQNERTRLLPIVILSSLATDKQVDECLTAGASSCVEKPMDARAYTDHVSMIVRYWLTVDRRPEGLNVNETSQGHIRQIPSPHGRGPVSSGELG